MHAGDGIDQRTLVLCGGDAIQFGLEWPQAFGIDCLLVHAGAVVVANLLVNRAAAGPASSSLLQNVPQGDTVPLFELREADPLRLIGRDLRLCKPVPAGVLVEIHTWISRLVDVVDAETNGGLPGRRSLSEGN